jgi:copper resistance protein B
MKIFFLLFCLLSPLAFAMEDNQTFSFTRAEISVGQTRHQTGSAQSLTLEGWIGGDKDRVWWQGGGSRQAGSTSDSSAGVWYGHYFAPFWDAQVGLRADGKPQSARYFSLGVRGLAPYQFDTDLKFDVRSDGHWFAHGEFEQETLLTNQLIARSWLGASLSGANIDNTVRSGLYRADIGIQVRYELTRELAPFIEVARMFHPRASVGGEPDSTRVHAGMRLVW